ncbi:TetR family transcriptional regulator [Heyndrickxia sporothermodurans]|uniref:TetR/AcrR family transcriptional regulator n=1 Tax=Heyndrickxia sporothermodurans TaxID=46224 RepID=UPI000D3D0D37|nr:TetR/AcrR family transcriptional regulator [Heyndrickxia sporothermodurans]PTY76599.1 TetR family transcriptional regulator [Heyndrickxia sporothermodurans]
MPKKVDLVERRNQIAEATWQVILKKGIDKASIQNIAVEAKMSVGLIQHNFSSKDELIQYAMKLVLDRMEERVKDRSNAFSGTKEEALRSLMKFLIPISHEEVMEARVWIAFLGNSFSDPKLLELRKKMDCYSRKMMTIIVKLMEELGYLHKKNDQDLEVEILYSFIDGLVIHALQSPERYTDEKLDQLIEYYLKGRKEKKMDG